MNDTLNTQINIIPNRFQNPVWHGEELKAREERLAKGLTRLSDWSDAKQRIREQTH